MQSDFEDRELCLSFSIRQRTLSKATLGKPPSMAKELTATVSTRRRQARKATLATPPSIAKESTATVSNHRREASKATLATPPSMAKESTATVPTRRREARKATLATPPSIAKKSTATVSIRRREARKATNATTHVGADDHTVAEYLTADTNKQLRQAAIDNEDNLPVDSSNQIIDTAAASNDDLHAVCGHHAERTAEYLTADASNQLEPLRILKRIKKPTSIGAAYVSSLKCKRKK